jgi:hypothetical protein
MIVNQNIDGSIFIMHRMSRKSLWMAGLIALGCLILVGAPSNAQVVPDADGDGLGDDLERIGFPVKSDESGNVAFDLWDAVSGQWETTASIPGSDNCGNPDGIGCLSAAKPDLFVIWRAASPSNIDLASCDLFALGTKPTAAGGLGFNIWVLRENNDFVSQDRIFAGQGLSEQKAVVLVEDIADNVTVTGFSQYATINVEGKGQATIYSQTIVNNIEAAAVIDGNVQSSSGVGYCPDTPYGDNCLQCLHFQNTAIHEILHVMDTLDNTLKRVYSHHLTRGEYIMKPAIVFTEKKGKVTYYIPEEASSTTQANWDFNP